MDKYTQAYLITALWSSTDHDGNPLDDKHSINDCSEKLVDQATKDTKEFLTKAGELLDSYDLETAMHDFWFTRNGHGAGFWDGDYEKNEGNGEKLTKIAKSFGQSDLYIGDDGKIYGY